MLYHGIRSVAHQTEYVSLAAHRMLSSLDQHVLLSIIRTCDRVYKPNWVYYFLLKFDTNNVTQENWKNIYVICDVT